MGDWGRGEWIGGRALGLRAGLEWWEEEGREGRTDGFSNADGLAALFQEGGDFGD